MIAKYYYDPFGRRLWKEVDGTRTYFLYSDEGLIGEYDSSGNEIKAYGWKPGSTWSTNPLFVKIEGTYYWYQNDHLGTPQKIIGTNGLVVWAGVYDSFGNCQVEIEGIKNNLRFPGQYYDAETGLHYNWHRYYDPFTGRYLNTDPLGDSINLYAYVNNSPILWIDPWGLCAVDFVGKKAKSAWDWWSSLGAVGIDKAKEAWSGGGIAIDLGGGYGTGWGGKKYSSGGSAGYGFFVGVRPNSGGHAQLGGYVQQSYAEKVPGARLGLGINLTYYKGDSRDFFKGRMNYTMLTLFIGSLTKYTDPCTGKTTGWSISIGGKGFGLTGFEEGSSFSWSSALQE